MSYQSPTGEIGVKRLENLYEFVPIELDSIAIVNDFDIFHYYNPRLLVAPVEIMLFASHDDDRSNDHEVISSSLSPSAFGMGLESRKLLWTPSAGAFRHPYTVRNSPFFILLDESKAPIWLSAIFVGFCSRIASLETCLGAPGAEEDGRYCSFERYSLDSVQRMARESVRVDLD
jgi:hypothetical protein